MKEKNLASRLKKLFDAYVTKNSGIVRPGPELRDETGALRGNVERMEFRQGLLILDGWALASRIGVNVGSERREGAPDRERRDVTEHFRESPFKTPGFHIEIPFFHAPAAIALTLEEGRLVYGLPLFTPEDLRQARLKAAARFVFALPRAWADVSLKRKPGYKAALGLVPPPPEAPPDVEMSLFRALEGEPQALAQSGVIDIILPVYNAFELLPEVLERVETGTDLPFRLIIAEDCSSDERVRPFLRHWLETGPDERRARATLIENPKNLGFIGSVNNALRVSAAEKRHVVLLNSDALVPRGWASRLLRPLLRAPEIVASVTPMSNDAEIFSVPVIVRRRNLEPGQADRIDETARRFNPDIFFGYAPTGVGFCMAMNRTFLDRVPSLDPIFGRGYGEEVDWCQKVRALGGRHAMAVNLFVEHRGGASFGSDAKLELVRKNNQIVSGRYPSYDSEVQDFIHRDPAAPARLALAVAWAAAARKGRLPVWLAHSWGGGAKDWLKNRIEQEMRTHGPALVLRVGAPGRRWILEAHGPDGATRAAVGSFELLQKLLEPAQALHLVYSCGAGDPWVDEIPQVLLALRRGPQDSVQTLFHDYLPISPSYTLLGDEGRYEGVPPESVSTGAHSFLRRDDGRKLTVGDWRARWRPLLEASEEITVFSQSSADLVREAYPGAASRIAVRPHALLAAPKRLASLRSADGKPVIGVMGGIGYPKGAQIIVEMSQELERTKAARIVVIGVMDPAFRPASSAVIHGAYRREEIAELATRYGVSCWLMPSIWPETFSYVTHEALGTGLPVWCFDLGAQAEAVRAALAAGAPGGIVPLTRSGASKDMLERILASFSS